MMKVSDSDRPDYEGLPPLAGTHYDDQAERSLEQAPEDFPRQTGAGGRLEPDHPRTHPFPPDPDSQIMASDARGG